MIETPRLLLRPHRADDFDAWFAMFNDDALFRFIGAPHLSEEDAWSRLLRYAGHWALLGYGLFAVFEKATGCFIGEAGLADFHRGLGAAFDGVPEAAWILTGAAQGRGYAEEATAAAHRWLDEAGISARTVCIISPANAPSLRLAGRLGYRAFSDCRYRERDYIMLQRFRMPHRHASYDCA